MSNRNLILALTLIAAPAAIVAQSSSSQLVAGDDSEGSSYRPAPSTQSVNVGGGPFSRMAIGGNVSPLGAGVQVTTYIDSHFNVRALGSGFGYSTNFTEQGFNANAKLNLASAGIAADIYPFHKGFRLSPGLMVLNNNRVTATSAVAGGTSITLNDQTYYSANTNAATGATPLTANAKLGLNTTRPAFTMTTGWGNTIPRDGNHWSFPFEVGAAFVGTPSLVANLNGWACYDQAQTECTNVADTSNPIAQQIQGNLTSQIAKWKNDVSFLKTYPIASFGVAYSFGTHGSTH
jgi:hypothetical protein